MSATNYEFLGFLVSVLAIIISAIALIRSRKTHNEFLALEKIHVDLSSRQIKEMETLEEIGKKAHIEFDVIDGSVYLANTGLAKARDVSLHFAKESDKHFSNGEFERLPYPQINPDQEIRLLASYNTMGSPQTFSVEVTWVNEDDSLGRNFVVHS